MKTNDLLLLGGLALAAYYFLSPKQGTGSSGVSGGWASSDSAGVLSPTAATTPTAPSFHTSELNNYLMASGVPSSASGALSQPIVSSTGHIIATDIFKGRASINQAAQIANIQSREGVNTPIKTTANPLEVQYTVAGGKTFTSSRRPASEAEATAARAANIADLRSRGVVVRDKYGNPM